MVLSSIAITMPILPTPVGTTYYLTPGITHVIIITGTLYQLVVSTNLLDTLHLMH